MTKPLSERLLETLPREDYTPDCVCAGCDYKRGRNKLLREAAARLKELEDARVIDIGGFKYKAIEVRE